ncbi:MAG: hypothetical protein AAB019_05685, partial [Planctomycetota bacterium]
MSYQLQSQQNFIIMAIPIWKKQFWQIDQPASYLIRLRWVAFIFVTFACLLALKLQLLPQISRIPLMSGLAILALSNLIYHYIQNKTRSDSSGFIFIQMSVDLLLLTFILHFSGGPENLSANGNSANP